MKRSSLSSCSLLRSATLLVALVMMMMMMMMMMIGICSASSSWLQGAPRVRTTLPPLRGNRTATLRICGLGTSFVKINGKQHFDRKDVAFDEPWTFFNNTAVFKALDVTYLLFRDRPSTLDVALFGGRYTPNWYQGPSQTILFVELDFDGAVVTRSDSSSAKWQCLDQASSPYVEATIYGGTTYDERLEDETKWLWWPCRALPASQAPRRLIAARHDAPVTYQETLSVKESWTLRDKSGSSTIFFDFGQNAAAVLGVSFSLPATANAQNCFKVEMQHAELLWNENRTLNRNTLGMANATDALIIDYSSSGKNSTAARYFVPAGTFHGFRFASVRCVPVDKTVFVNVLPVIHNVVSITMRTRAASSKRIIAELSHPDPVLSSVLSAMHYSVQSNLQSIPIDCPQRDERLGWLADAHLGSFYSMLFFDLRDYYRHFVRDVIADSMTSDFRVPSFTPPCDPEDGDVLIKCDRAWAMGSDPSWASAFIIIPWNAFVRYGDVAVLEENYADLQSWLTQLTGRASSNGIAEFGDFGDWLPPLQSKVDTWLVSTYSLFISQKIMAKISKLLGMDDDAYRWQREANKTRTAFNTAYFEKATCSYRTQYGQQAALVLPLSAGIVDEASRACVAARLVSIIKNGDLCPGNTVNETCLANHLSTGIISFQSLFDVLSDNGYHSFALTLAKQTTFPSLGYMTATMGGTTLWENWNYERGISNPEGSSHNHQMLSSVSKWFMEKIGGLKIGVDEQTLRRHFMVDLTFACDNYYNATAGGGASVVAEHASKRSVSVKYSWLVASAQVVATITCDVECILRQPKKADVTLPAATQGKIVTLSC